MPDNFYINYSGATQPHGIGYCSLREIPQKHVDALLPLLQKLLEGTSDPGEKHICPICGETVKISFEYYIEMPIELDICFDCGICNIYIFFKSNRIPLWARTTSLKDLPGFFD